MRGINETRSTQNRKKLHRLSVHYWDAASTMVIINGITNGAHLAGEEVLDKY